MSRLRAALLIAFLLFTIAVGEAVPVSAATLTVNDNEAGMEAYFLAISSARFTNGEKQVVARVDHPTLHMTYVDLIKLDIRVGPKSTPYDTSYTAEWRRGYGVRFFSQRPGQEFRQRRSCRGLSILRSDADHRVVVKVPVACVKGSRQVSVSYLISDVTADVTDTVPGHQHSGQHSGRYTRWFVRG